MGEWQPQATDPSARCPKFVQYPVSLRREAAPFKAFLLCAANVCREFAGRDTRPTR
jgi:hypothetical protein